MLEDPRVLECLDLTEAPYRPVVNKHVRHAPPLASRQLRKPTTHYGVLGGADVFEAVAPLRLRSRLVRQERQDGQLM